MRKKFMITLILLLILLFGSSIALAATTLEEGLIVYYSFENDFTESNGTSTYDLTSSRYPTQGQFKGRKAVKFVENQAEYLKTSENILAADQDFSYMAWYYFEPESPLNSRYFILETSVNYPASYGIRGQDDNTYIGEVFTYQGINGDSFSINDNGDFGESVGQWYNIIVTYNHSTGTHSAYLNGNAAGNFSSAISEALVGLVVGSYRNNDGRYWDGYIDEVAVWNRVLDASDILNLQETQLVSGNKTYQVTYDGNGHDTGQPPEDESIYERSTTVTVKGYSNLDKSGYYFDSWNTQVDGSGDVYAPGDTFNIDTYGNDLTLYAQYNRYPVAGFGYALAFDGTDDYVDLGDGVVLGETFTQEAWIYPNETTNGQFRGFLGYEFEPQDTSLRPPSLWSYDKTKLHGGFGGNGAWNSWITQEDVLLVDTWNHIAVSYDGSYYKVYVNGNLKEPIEMTATPVDNPVKYIGRVDNYFQGNIDEVRLWDTALSEETLKTWMNRGVENTHSNYSNLKGYWQFNENSGTSTVDPKNNIIGDLNNGPLWETSTIPNRYYVDEGDKTTIYLIGYDSEGESLSYSITSEPSAGSLTEMSTGVYEYTHAGDEVFQDAIAYRVNDGREDSINSAQIDIRINPINDSPTVPGTFTSPSGSVLDADSSINLTWGESTDIEGESVTYALEYWDGSQWQLINDNFSLTNESYNVPNENVDQLQWRVKAYDGVDYSDYRNSSIYDIQYTVDFLDHENVLIEQQNIIYGESANPPAALRQGYTLTGWSVDFINVQGPITTVAEYEPRTDTEYTVEHYQENLDGTYAVSETEVLTGTTDTTISAPVKSYIGFSENTGHVDRKEIGTITPDGLLVLKVFYNRETYNVTFLDYNGEVLDSQGVLYEKDATPPVNPTRQGYQFSEWLGTYTDIQNNTVLTADYLADDNTPYKVFSYEENVLDENFTEVNTANLTGTTDTEVTLTFADKTGFVPNNSKSVLTGMITSDGSLVLEIYYDREEYAVDFLDYENTIIKTDIVKYQGNAIPPSNPSRIGYTFTGWQDNYNTITSNKTVKAGYSANGETPYKVEYYLENIDNDAYTLEKSNMFSGTTDSDVSVILDDRTGFVPNNNKSILISTIAPDGSLVLKKYYDRKTYTVQFLDYNDNILKIQEVKYQENAIAPETPNRSGYYFRQWDNGFNNVNNNLVVKAMYVKMGNESDRNEALENTTDTEIEDDSFIEEPLEILEVMENDEATEVITENNNKSRINYFFNSKEILERIQNDNSIVESNRVLEANITTKDSDEINVFLENDLITGLTAKGYELKITSDIANYTLPITELSQKYGTEDFSKGDIIDYEITIKKDSPVEKEKEVKKGQTLGYGVVSNPVSFKVERVINKNQIDEERSEIKTFDNYVQRRVKLPFGINPKKITTGIRENSDDTITHVPTTVFFEDGFWYAKMNSLTNSKYTVIWHNVGVRSAKNHWAEEAINDMASRVIIENYNEFKPNEKVTIVEFLGYLTKGLGIYNSDDYLSTVEESSTVKSAKAYAIVDKDTIIADNQLTSHALRVYLKNAAKLIDHATYDTDAVIDKIVSSVIKDKERIYLTKAEVLVVLRGFLIEFDLINE